MQRRLNASRLEYKEEVEEMPKDKEKGKKKKSDKAKSAAQRLIKAMGIFPTKGKSHHDTSLQSGVSKMQSHNKALRDLLKEMDK